MCRGAGRWKCANYWRSSWGRRPTICGFWGLRRAAWPTDTQLPLKVQQKTDFLLVHVNAMVIWCIGKLMAFYQPLCSKIHFCCCSFNTQWWFLFYWMGLFFYTCNTYGRRSNTIWQLLFPKGPWGWYPPNPQDVLHQRKTKGGGGSTPQSFRTKKGYSYGPKHYFQSI